jgi:hypothetical protein
MRPAMPDHRLNATGCLILPASLFIGLMIAGPGTAVYPPVSTWTAPLICSGNVEVDSNYYSVRPGENGVSRTIYCVSGEGKGARSEITWSAIGVAFLVYAAIAFLALRFLVAPWLRRRADRALLSVGIRSPSDPGAPASAADLRAILAQVSEAVGRGGANVVVRHAQVDLSGDGDDLVERLAQLKRLRDQGLISAADYEAKKAEILSRL